MEEITWINSKEGTLEVWYDGTMYFDINKEQGRYAVYNMKRDMVFNINRPDFKTEELAKKYAQEGIPVSSI